MSLPIYVINLDRRPDRWEAVAENLGRLGFQPTRITAVDAKIVPDEQLKQRVAIESPFLGMGRGSEANVLSHCKAWEALLDSSHPAALVAEDDALFASDLGSVLGSVDWWPVGAGLLKLEIIQQKRRLMGPARGYTPSGRKLHRMVRWSGGTAGYLIDRNSAHIALEACTGIDMPIDHVLFDVLRSPLARRLRPYQVVPAMVSQRGEDSDIYALKTAAQSNGSARGAGTISRRLGIALRKLALTTSRATGRVRRLYVGYSDRYPG